MLSADSGVTATVHRPSPECLDELGITRYGEPETDVVAGVLVAPADATRAAGAGDDRRGRAALTLHFPKAYDARLEGCTVDLPEPWGEGWQVLGDPMPYDPALTPGPWNRPVEVARTNA